MDLITWRIARIEISASDAHLFKNGGLICYAVTDEPPSLLWEKGEPPITAHEIANLERAKALLVGYEPSEANTVSINRENMRSGVVNQPRQHIEGDCRFYEFEDGHASAADDGGWVSALFTSLDAARSWRGHFDEAEAEFRRLNNGPQGEVLVPPRDTVPNDQQK